MQTLLPVILLLLTSSWAGAAMNEMEQAASAPSDMVDVAYVVLFIVLFFGMIAWFFVHMWRSEKKNKQD